MKTEPKKYQMREYKISGGEPIVAVKHTQGEWKQDRGYIQNNEKVLICSLHVQGEEGEANAKLIASAPELLEALNNFMSYYEEYGHKKSPFPERLISPIRIAIKKATT